jgi:hypothetical protein
MKLMDFYKRWQNFETEHELDETYAPGSSLRRVTTVVGIIFIALIVLGMYWSVSPDNWDVQENTNRILAIDEQPMVIGAATTATLIGVMETLLDKRGGYLSNDKMPPGVWLDNMPNWEFGVLVQSRDLARAMRETFSRSQTQSREDKDLADAEPRLNFNNDSWLLPASESEYREGIGYLYHYLNRLADPAEPTAQFYARADNLTNWLGMVETRLGSMSQNLSASVGVKRMNTDLAGEPGVRQSTESAAEVEIRTPRAKLDDVFYEAQGSSWALIQFLRAVEIDFADVLKKKNAQVSLQQIIRELEGTQQVVWSPMILNGTGFGVMANHSLVMASYISRAHAAIADLRTLLTRG